MNKRILIAAGGSGGHLLPAQQLASLLKQEADVFFAGSGLSKNPFFHEKEIRFKDIVSSPLSHPLKFLYSTPFGLAQSLSYLLKVQPDVVVGFGSYHTFTLLAAAILLRKKLILYEANCVLGKVNRFFAPFTTKLALQFPLINPSKAPEEYVSYFPWVSSLKRSKKEALKFYGLTEERPTILVFGGSQGASFFNEKAPPMLSGFQVIHCAGKKESLSAVSALYEKEKIPAFVQAFEPDMARAYAAADFALCRSGATTIAELIRYELPALLIPYPYAADDHQAENARFFCSEVQGGFWQRESSGASLRFLIDKGLSQLDSLRASMRSFREKTDKKAKLLDLVREL